MKKSLFFKQEKPSTVWILGGLLLLFTLWFIVGDSHAPLNQIVVMGVISVLLLGYSVSYEIAADFNNKRHFNVFGLSVYRSKLEILVPEYLVVFSAKFKQSAEWGPVGAMGRERGENSWVIRLFKGHRHFTVYKTKSLQKAKDKALELSELIGVEIRS